MRNLLPSRRTAGTVETTNNQENLSEESISKTEADANIDAGNSVVRGESLGLQETELFRGEDYTYIVESEELGHVLNNDWQKLTHSQIYKEDNVSGERILIYEEPDHNYRFDFKVFYGRLSISGDRL